MDIIKIGIVEDDTHWQKILSNFLNFYDYFQVVWIASQRDLAVKLAEETRNNTDVILMDLNLSGDKWEGIYATYDICQKINTKIIILSSFSDGNLIKDAFAAGAVNYILKENFKQLPDAIMMTIKGKSPVEELLSEYKNLKKEQLLKVLTQSEREVFNLLEKGKSQKDIYKLLFKTESTIKGQINSILKKLKAQNTKDAIEIVRRLGIVKTFLS